MRRNPLSAQACSLALDGHDRWPCADGSCLLPASRIGCFDSSTYDPASLHRGSSRHPSTGTREQMQKKGRTTEAPQASSQEADFDLDSQIMPADAGKVRKTTKKKPSNAPPPVLQTSLATGPRVTASMTPMWGWSHRKPMDGLRKPAGTMAHTLIGLAIRQRSGRGLKKARAAIRASG